MLARGWVCRLAAAVIFGVALGQAAPSLVTIQDTLYKADGMPFNGFLLIEWKSFEAADSSNIAMQSLTAPVIDGVLVVRLVPNSSGSSYSVKYSSDGRIQFQETWVVPAVNATLRLKDVRAATLPDAITPPGETTQIPESDVTGLAADLAARPVKAAGYAPSRAVYIDASGALDAVIGNMGDCVRVDGTSGPCGGSNGPGFVDGEMPAGLINGSNVLFTLADTPTPATSLALYRNGLLQKQSLDYTVSGNAITFSSGSTPQPGDILTASYRLADPGNPVGQAGGALLGTYPNPSLGVAVIMDSNVSAGAGIRETKLALNYPTHSNANDPAAGEKAALAGTAGPPSASNKFVTEQDSRLTDSRTPLAHPLLGASHGDSAAVGPVRGDVIVAQGTSPALWTRLPIGPANRCLMSNGSDAIWNTCLYTGFAAGSIPFVDSNGNLAQNASRLAWDNTNRKLSVGNNSGASTVYVWDAQASTGTTGLTVRAGAGQGSSALQTWLSASGGELARVDAAGNFSGASFAAATSATRAGWQDAGAATDPAVRTNGDAWYSTAAQGRKTVEGGQVHTLPQVLCSATGVGASSTSLTQLGSCTIPAGLLKAGDRVDVRFDTSHEGSGVGFTFEVHWGATTLLSRSSAASVTVLGGSAEAGVYASGAQYHAQSWDTGLAAATSAGTASDSLAAAIAVGFFGRMSAATSETVTLRNFTVLRYPAQQNP